MAEPVIAQFVTAICDAIEAREAAQGRPFGDATATAILRDAIRRMGDAIAPISEPPAAAPPCASGVTGRASSDARPLSEGA